MTSIISGWSVPPTKPWHWWRTELLKSMAAGFLPAAARSLPKCAMRSAGLMSQRPAEELDAEMQQLYAAAETIEWLYEPTFSPRWYPVFPNGCNSRP